MTAVACFAARVGTVACNNDIDLEPDQLGRVFCGVFIAALCPAILNREVATIDPAEFTQPLHKSGNSFAFNRRVGAQEPDGRQLSCLLRLRRERPSGRRAAEQCDELAPPDHSITSSARASRDGGTSRPSALAVLRLITSSNLVGCMIGKSFGFSPARIRPVYRPAVRNSSVKVAP